MLNASRYGFAFVEVGIAAARGAGERDHGRHREQEARLDPVVAEQRLRLVVGLTVGELLRRRERVGGGLLAVGDHRPLLAAREHDRLRHARLLHRERHLGAVDLHRLGVDPAARAQQPDQLPERGRRLGVVGDLDHRAAVDVGHARPAHEEGDVADPAEDVLLQVDPELLAQLLLDRRAAERAGELAVEVLDGLPELGEPSAAHESPGSSPISGVEPVPPNSRRTCGRSRRPRPRSACRAPAGRRRRRTRR